MGKILEIEEIKKITKNGKEVERVIFSNDKIVYVRTDTGEVYPDDTPDRYIDLINIYKASHDKKDDDKTTKKIEGHYGWFLFFIVTLFLSAVITFIDVFANPIITLTDCTTAGYSVAECQKFIDYSNVEQIVSVAVGVSYFIAAILIICRKKVAIEFTFSLLIFVALYAILDTILSYKLLDSMGISTSYVDTTRWVGNLTYSTIWCIYLRTSKRVKSTLIK